MSVSLIEGFVPMCACLYDTGKGNWTAEISSLGTKVRSFICELLVFIGNRFGIRNSAEPTEGN